MDDNIVCATAQSVQLPVDLGAGGNISWRPPTYSLFLLYQYLFTPVCFVCETGLSWQCRMYTWRDSKLR